MGDEEYFDENVVLLNMESNKMKKVIKKNRFVCINTAANPFGPWCLGFSDIHKVNAVYGCNSSGYYVGTDITNSFVYSSGQKDTHYDLG